MLKQDCRETFQELSKRAAQAIPPTIGHLMKSLTGKGPEVVKVTVDTQDIIIKIYGFLTNGERSLLSEPTGKNTIQDYRNGIIKSDLDKIRNFMSDNLSVNIVRVFCDFCAESDEAVIILRYA